MKQQIALFSHSMINEGTTYISESMVFRQWANPQYHMAELNSCPHSEKFRIEPNVRQSLAVCWPVLDQDQVARVRGPRPGGMCGPRAPSQKAWFKGLGQTLRVEDLKENVLENSWNI